MNWMMHVGAYHWRGGSLLVLIVLLAGPGVHAAGLAGPGPRPAAGASGRLARWSFDAGVLGDRGQAPIVNRTETVPGFIGSAAGFPRTGTPVLCYRDVESNGRPNFNPTNGTVRFWFKPNWTTTSARNVGGPRTHARFVELGAYQSAGGWWSLHTDPDGLALGFATAATVDGRLEFHYPFERPYRSRPDFQSNQWSQIVLTYSPVAAILYFNGEVLEVGSGVRLGPTAAARANGIVIGNDASGSQGIDGAMDEVEFFDRPLMAREVARDYRDQRVASIRAGSGLATGSVPKWPYRSFRQPGEAGRTNRLAYWRFDGDAIGEEGQAPMAARQLGFQPSWSGQAVDLSRNRGARLILRLAETNGSANLFAEHGTLRFWFRPHWSSGSRRPTEATLLAGTDSRAGRTLWSLVVDAAGDRLSLRNASGTDVVTGPARFQANQWCQLAVTYDTNRSLLVFNGELLGSSRGSEGHGAIAGTLPLADSLAVGGNFAGDAPADGEFDELELFGEPVDLSRQITSFLAFQEVDSNRNGVVDLAEELSLDVSAPFSSVPAVAVGVLPAEHFDRGGEGVAYHSGRDHGLRRFRASRLAIEPSDDRGGGWCVGRLAAGDWLAYTFEVRHAGAYSLVLRAAPQSQPGGGWNMEVSGPGGVRLNSPELRIAEGTWSNLAWSNVVLNPGTYKLRVRAAVNGPDGFAGRLNDIAIIPWMPVADAAVPSRRVEVTGLIADVATLVAAEANTKALERAVAKLGRRRGGHLVLPAGTYFVASPPATRRTESQGFWGPTQAALRVEGVQDVVVAGAPGRGTTLVAFDRTTTILLMQDCRRVTLQDVVFKGRPFRRLDGGIERLPIYQTCPECQFNYGAGSLAMMQLTRDLLVRNCEFINPAFDGVILDAVTNATFTGNEFVFFNGEPVDGVVARFETVEEASKGSSGGVGIFSGASSCVGMVVVGNRYNGHPNLSAAEPETRAGDGIVWFSNGANFHVAENVVVNFGLEGVAINSGPAAVVRNQFTTVKRYPATTPLLFAPAGWSNRIWAYRPEDQTLSFVGNEIDGGTRFIHSGWVVSKRLPFDVRAADNRGRLVQPTHLGRTDWFSSAFELPDADRVCLSGNRLVSGDIGANFSGNLRFMECLGNDFSAANQRPLRFNRLESSLRWVVAFANDFGAGKGAHLELPWTMGSRFFLRGNNFRQHDGASGEVLHTFPPDVPVHGQASAAH